MLNRVPYTEKYADNENNSSIITAVRCGGPMGMPYSTQYLDREVKPMEWCTLRKAKIGEDAYSYVPSKPLGKGFYLIDYKINGASTDGWNAIQNKINRRTRHRTLAARGVGL